MKKVIVDTNVMVVANRQNPQVAEECADKCVEFIVSAKDARVVLIDDGDEIRSEYAAALSDARPYQLGAQFLNYIYHNQWDVQRVKRVKLEKTAMGEFADFPDVLELSKFDRSDRKFAALARKTKTPVTNATDSDWADSLVALNANGIDVEFLCGCDKSKWFKD